MYKIKKNRKEKEMSGMNDMSSISNQLIAESDMKSALQTFDTILSLVGNKPSAKDLKLLERSLDDIVLSHQRCKVYQCDMQFGNQIQERINLFDSIKNKMYRINR